jgi:hypothetical protein
MKQIRRVIIRKEKKNIQSPSTIQQWGLFLGSCSVARVSQVLSFLRIVVIIDITENVNIGLDYLCQTPYSHSHFSTYSGCFSNQQGKKLRFVHCAKGIHNQHRQ